MLPLNQKYYHILCDNYLIIVFLLKIKDPFQEACTFTISFDVDITENNHLSFYGYESQKNVLAVCIIKIKEGILPTFYYSHLNKTIT